MEKWKDIPNYEGLYKISSLGRVKSLHKNKEHIMKPNISRGYRYVKLSNGLKKRRNIKVSVLVAMAFLNHKPDGTNKIVVDHIDEIKTNDCVENLQLITNRANVSKSAKGSSKYTGVFRGNKNNWRAAIRINGKNKYLGTFKTEIEASNAYQKALSIIEAS